MPNGGHDDGKYFSLISGCDNYHIMHYQILFLWRDPFFERGVLFITQNYYEAFCCCGSSNYDGNLHSPAF